MKAVSSAADKVAGGAVGKAAGERTTRDLLAGSVETGRTAGEVASSCVIVCAAGNAAACDAALDCVVTFSVACSVVADDVSTYDAAGRRDDSSCKSCILRNTVEAARVEDSGAAVADLGV